MQNKTYVVLALLVIAEIIALITWFGSTAPVDFVQEKCKILGVKYICLFGKMERVSHLEFLEWLGSLVGVWENNGNKWNTFLQMYKMWTLMEYPVVIDRHYQPFVQNVNTNLRQTFWHSTDFSKNSASLSIIFVRLIKILPLRSHTN